MDIVDVPLLEPKPDGFQAENWLLDPNAYWRKVGSFRPVELAYLLDPVEPLWINGHHTYHGRNDRIPGEVIGGMSSSLRMIRVDALELRVFAPGEAFGNNKRRVQGRFLHAGDHYAIRLTDPVYEREYLAKPDGTHYLGPCFLTLSVGEPFKGAHYKLLAAIIKTET